MPKPFEQETKKGGFRVGPQLGATNRGVYQGHTQKIKATLIHKAKVKKSYYKDLEREGYGGTGSNGGELGVRKQKIVKPVLGAQRRGAEASEEEEESDREELESEADSDSDTEKKGRGPKNVKPGKGGRSQPPPRENAIVGSKPKPYDRPVKKPRLSEKEIEAIREKKAGERKEWGKRGAKGQPKLGSRVEMLLGRIKRGMEKESQ